MEHFPSCPHPSSLIGDTYDSSVPNSYKQLIKVISHYINGDCWGIVVNDEIIYNAYDTSRSFREKIIDSSILRDCRKDIHGALLSEINRLSKDATIDIFMYPKLRSPICMRVTYLESNANIPKTPIYWTEFFASYIEQR
jgi:hypothetical protein